MEQKKGTDEVLREVLHKLYDNANAQDVEFMLADIKSQLENILGNSAFITSRIKGPTSIAKKFAQSSKYAVAWNAMKDLVGLMVVVDTNEQVDLLKRYIEFYFGDSKNPNAETLVVDYRTQNYRETQGFESDSSGVDEDLSKGYQTNNGYKNVKCNLMRNGYPIEIQLKTSAQYIAHVATHDPVYKSPLIDKLIKEALAIINDYQYKDESVEELDARLEANPNIDARTAKIARMLKPLRTNKEGRVEYKAAEKQICTTIAGALFPYFEASAHYELHHKTMSDEQLATCQSDVNAIYERNAEIYQLFPEIFDDACQVYAAALFTYKNRKQLYADALLQDNVLNAKLLECEVLRIFNYLQRQFEQDRSLTPREIFTKTIDEIINMDYRKFTRIRKQIAGQYRIKKCIITGIYDLLRETDIRTIERFRESFKNVQIGIFDDEFAEIFSGRKTIFSQEERAATLRMIKGVSDVVFVGKNGEVKFNHQVAPLSIGVPKPKKYKYGYVPGVFDMAHPGHIEYFKAVLEQCEHVIIASKSDYYVRTYKNKEPVLKENERKCILGAIRNIYKVVTTDYDILPPEEVVELFRDESQKGNKCAVFMGSDWILKPEVKGPESLKQLEILETMYDFIYRDYIPRGEKKRSTSGYSKEGLLRLEDRNPNEVPKIIYENIN